MAVRILTLDGWRLREGLTHKQLGQMIGCTGHMAYVYCCDPKEPASRVPRADRMARIFTITNGEVGPASFYKLPKLTRPFDRAAVELPLMLPGSAPYYAPERPATPPGERKAA